MTESPWQWGAAATFAIAYPIAANNDSQWSASAIRDPLIGEPKKNGDLLLEGMMGASLGLAAYEWYSGDQGTATEVLLESAVLSAIIVESLKSTVRRQRPAGSNSNASFPSGHATTAFIAATMISRRIDDYYDGPTGYLGYLSYLPAAVVALNRVENGRHYPSDVIVGALLGTVLTNVIYNAHYGTGKSAGGLQARHERRYHLVPQLDGDYVGIGLEVRF